MNGIRNLIAKTDEFDEGSFSFVRISAAALALCLVFGGVGLFFAKLLPLIRGLFLGWVIAVLLFRLHGFSIDKLLGGGKNPDAVSRGGYFIRMLIRGAALYIAVKNPDVSIYGCAVGLLSVPYGIYALAIAESFGNSKKKGGKE